MVAVTRHFRYRALDCFNNVTCSPGEGRDMWRSNRLMRVGRSEEASALTKLVWVAITRQNSLLLRNCHTRKSVKLIWVNVG